MITGSPIRLPLTHPGNNMLCGVFVEGLSIDKTVPPTQEDMLRLLFGFQGLSLKADYGPFAEYLLRFGSDLYPGRHKAFFTVRQHIGFIIRCLGSERQSYLSDELMAFILMMPRCSCGDETAEEEDDEPRIASGETLERSVWVDYGPIGGLKTSFDQHIVAQFAAWQRLCNVVFTIAKCPKDADISVVFTTNVGVMSRLGMRELITLAMAERKDKANRHAILIDAGEFWDDDNQSHVETINAGVLHFIGHCLGVPHESEPSSVMNPYQCYVDARRPQLVFSPKTVECLGKSRDDAEYMSSAALGEARNAWIAKMVPKTGEHLLPLGDIMEELNDRV